MLKFTKQVLFVLMLGTTVLFCATNRVLVFVSFFGVKSALVPLYVPMLLAMLFGATFFFVMHLFSHK